MLDPVAGGAHAGSELIGRLLHPRQDRVDGRVADGVEPGLQPGDRALTDMLGDGVRRELGCRMGMTAGAEVGVRSGERGGVRAERPVTEQVSARTSCPQGPGGVHASQLAPVADDVDAGRLRLGGQGEQGGQIVGTRDGGTGHLVHAPDPHGGRVIERRSLRAEAISRGQRRACGDPRSIMRSPPPKSAVILIGRRHLSQLGTGSEQLPGSEQ